MPCCHSRSRIGLLRRRIGRGGNSSGDAVVVPFPFLFPFTDLQPSKHRPGLNNRQKPGISSEQPCGIGCRYPHWISLCMTTFLSERRSLPIL
jgi:hypothetical protein